MENACQTSTTDGTTEKVPTGRRYSIGLILLGVVLILLALVWAAPVLGYEYLLNSVLSPERKEQFAPFLHAKLFSIRFFAAIFVISPLPLLVCGIGLLWSARWAKYCAMLFLALQLGWVLISMNFLVRDLTHGITLSPDLPSLYLYDTFAANNQDYPSNTVIFLFETPENLKPPESLKPPATLKYLTYAKGGFIAWQSLLIVLLLIARAPNKRHPLS